ncbi:helix-turn-helix transcriptional regulator [Kitasatospora sp. NPDC096147]|uniref:helix-turn-helix transcriptional regulator n=1 Tax=Kitasatospora sp. NPDC096147 TaxID=3364093 RepID=UPI003821D8DB
MRADRLLSIMLLLQTRGLVPASELAERLEVSVRTVYRDVEALSAAGVPVFAERGRTGGIRLLPGYRTDVTGLTADEARALFVLATDGTHDALGLGGAIGSALRKVMAALPAPHRPEAERTSERILVDPHRWAKGPAAPGQTELDELQRAVFGDHRLALTYRHGRTGSGSDGPSTYTVDPYGLVSKAGVWYLVADLDGVPRLFRADRVVRAASTGEPVRRRPGLGLAGVWAGLRAQVERQRDEVRVTARVHRQRLDLVLRIHSSSVLAPPVPDGPSHLLVEFGFGAPAEVRTLLPFGTDVEVLAPPEARRLLAGAAAETLRMYTDAGGAGDGPSGSAPEAGVPDPPE